MKLWKQRAQELVDQHWDYHEVLIPLFESNNEPETTREQWGAWYKEVGKHFYKHAIEDVKAGIVDLEDS